MKKLFSRMDKPLLITMIIFSILGLVMVFSASSVSAVLRYGVSSYYFFLRQLVFFTISYAVGLIIVIRFPTSKYKFLTPFLVVGVIAALAGLFMYGFIAGGAQSWYSLGFFNLQPLEFAKAIMIVYMAVFYSRTQKKKNAKPLTYLIPLAVGFVITMLVAMQPDLGGAIIIAAITFLTFLAVPLPNKSKQMVIRVLVVGVFILIAGLLITGKTLFTSNQLSRFEFRNPCSRYTQTTGYQVCNGYIAIHNGGLFGVGLGNSTQKYLYLPEAHTDFIFPIIVEELGAIVGILVLLGYAFMLYRIIKIAKQSENLRCSILAYGTALLLLAHILVNLLGVLALIPLTGVPLPLLSYGGSFNMPVIIMLFVVQRVAIENSINKSKREIASI